MLKHENNEKIELKIKGDKRYKNAMVMLVDYDRNLFTIDFPFSMFTFAL